MRSRWTHLLLGIALIPYGPLDARLEQENPWNGFEADGPNLLVAWARKIPSSDGSWDCSRIGSQLAALPPSEELAVGRPVDAGWGPWSKDAREQVTDCDSFPCDVKLDRKETESLSELPEVKRLEAYLARISTRIEAYRASEARPEMEWPGPRRDPWTEFESRGFGSKSGRPPVSTLVGRVLKLVPGKMKEVRQVLDRRTRSSATEAELWIRDLYSDHYLDAWGERYRFECDSGGLRIYAALFVEFDLLKQQDVFSLLGRPRMRLAVKEEGRAYLEGMVEQALRGSKRAASTP